MADYQYRKFKGRIISDTTFTQSDKTILITKKSRLLFCAVNTVYDKQK